MVRNIMICWLVLIIAGMAPVLAQDKITYGNLDPKPYNPEIDPNPDMFISSWKESMPRNSHGCLVEMDIFTPLTSGDPLRPSTKGAVLTYYKRFSHASLEPRAKTTPMTLSGEQEIFYIDSGTGIIRTSGKTAELHNGVGVIMPPGIEYVIENTGNMPLTMYLIVEPIPEGYTPKKEMVVKDENVSPIRDTTGHWCHIDRQFFLPKDDLWITGGGMNPVWFDPMTMGQPHSHKVGIEEIWFALEGDIHILLSKQIRRLEPGSAYKIPPNGLTPHSNINVSDKPIKLVWFMYVPPNFPRTRNKQYANLDGKAYDPAVDPHIDMFMRDWRESTPQHLHGGIIVRDVFLPNKGDPMHPTMRGAVLTNLKRFCHGILYRGTSTQPSVLENEQEIFYIESGEGYILAGGKRAELHKGVGVIMPTDIEFTITCKSSEPLNMYILVENLPDGFEPKMEMVVKDENVLPFASTNAHWSYRLKSLFVPNDGLATLRGMGPVWLSPNTMGQPHSHGENTEEIWFALEGNIQLLLGKEIRKMPIGTAYRVPPNGTTPHSNINVSDKPIKLFWLMN